LSTGPVLDPLDAPAGQATPYVFEFSLDIGSDIELSDPNVDGDEAADPGDVYLSQSPKIVPPGRDGFKDDGLRLFGKDPAPSAPDMSTPPASRVPVGDGDPSEYAQYFDLDGHDQVASTLVKVVPPDEPVELPIPQFHSTCIFPVRYLAISYDDDMAPGWPAADVPVTKPSPGGLIYGTTAGQDEVVGVTVIPTGIAGTPYSVAGMYAITDEVGLHTSLAPNPDLSEADDDDVDSLDAVLIDTQCPVWLVSADHEAHFGLDPGSIYEANPLGGLPMKVIDQVVHLGLSDDKATPEIEDADIDAFELVWLPEPETGKLALALLFSVDEDDPVTLSVDESGKLNPGMIYASFLTGSSFPLLEKPLYDDIDALTNWIESMEPDFVETDEFEFTLAQMELIGPGGTVMEVVNLTGPTTVEVYFEGEEGEAYDDDGDGFDEVVTEMTLLDLTGESAGLGTVFVRLNPSIPTRGEIEEMSNDTPGTLDIQPFTAAGQAGSFFDVYVEVEIPALGGIKLYTQDPKRMSTVITNKPPEHGAIYENPTALPLYFPDGTPSGYSIGATRHMPNPPMGDDWGDAPEWLTGGGYPTRALSGGAHHTLVPGYHLGADVDVEPDGQPDPNALGDDNDILFPPANDDEDGVVFTPIVPGMPTTIEVTASAAGALDAWLDFGGDGNWTQTTDHIFSAAPLNAGPNTLSFNVPTSAVPGGTFARFRFSRTGGLPFGGGADNGEVEDYRVGIEDPSFPKWVQPPKPTEPGQPDNIYYGWNEVSWHEGPRIAADDWVCAGPDPVTGVVWWGSFLNFTDVAAGAPLPDSFHLAIWDDIPVGPNDAYSHPGDVIWEADVADYSTTFVGWDYDPRDRSFDAAYRFEADLPTEEWFRQDTVEDGIYWLSVAAAYPVGTEVANPWGWKTVERDPDSPAPDDAVRIADPTGAHLGDAYTVGGPIWWPTANDSWDLAFELKTVTDPSRPKWVQRPDLQTGMDVLAGPSLTNQPGGEPFYEKYLADDFLCTASGPISEIVLWTSYRQDEKPMKDPWFSLAIFEDIPADPIHGTYSMPGKALWDAYLPATAELLYATADEQFYDPNIDKIVGSDTQVWQYTFIIDEALAYPQIEDTVYWLGVHQTFDLTGDGTVDDSDLSALTKNYPASFGWKTSLDHWNDDAVWADVNTFGGAPHVVPDSTVGWSELRYPIGHRYEGKSIDLAFSVGVAPPPAEVKWLQKPDREPTGIDVNATMFDPSQESYVLADDFECIQTGSIDQITVWTSWYHDRLPGDNDPAAVSFKLSLHADIPATDTDYSKPGTLLWERMFHRGDFFVEQYAGNLQEGWLDPPDLYEQFADTQIWRYVFDLKSEEFIQRGTPDNPVVYWLDVQAQPMAVGVEPTRLGWKTSLDHWNDDAVWSRIDPATGNAWPWQELIYPADHPMAGKSIDLAFQISGHQWQEAIKWSQPPEPYVLENTYDGWDELSVVGGRQIVADDWVCETDTPVTDVHWWGSLIDWSRAEPFRLPDGFLFTIWTDVPKNVDEEFSHPGEVIWEAYHTDYTWVFDGWDINPQDPLAPPEATYLFEVDLPEDEWFWQDLGEHIYWISIAADYGDTAPSDVQYPWGWKTRPRDPLSPAPDDAVMILNPTTPGLPGPVLIPDDVFPAPGGTLTSANGTTYATVEVELVALSLTSSANSPVVAVPGPGVEFPCDSFFDVFVTIDLHDGAGPVETFLPHVRVKLLIRNDDSPGASTTGTFATEIISMSLSGLTGPVEIRVSPSIRSLGGHSSTLDPDSGMYHIDSFFDVFTELSVDGGESWKPAEFSVPLSVDPVGENKLIEAKPIFWPTEDDSWDTAFVLTTREMPPRELDFGDAPEISGAVGYPTTLLRNGARHKILPGYELGPGTIRVSQESSPGAGDFDANVLGFIDPYLTGLSTAGYYQYGTPHYASFNGPAPTLTSDRSHLFLAQATDGLALYVVHDKPVDGAGGTSRMHWELTGDTAGVLQGDDPGEGIVVSGGGTVFDSSHGWGACCTDGMALGSLEGAWTMVGSFVLDTSTTGMNEWYAYSADGSTIALAFEQGREIRLDVAGNIDAEPDGQPFPAGVGDDYDGNDDENGVLFLDPLTPGETVNVMVVASAPGVLQGWVDFNGNTDWSDPGEQIFTDQALVAGSNLLSFLVPAGTPLGSTFARFRFSSAAGLTFFGGADDGEVEDYRVVIEELDFGDALDPTFPTLFVNDGARHAILPGFFLGAGVDIDPNGQPNSAATGDDIDGNDDEDGVAIGLLVPGETVNVNVTLNPLSPVAAGSLDGWIDFNDDGDWDDANERVFTAAGLVPGLNVLPVTVPLDASQGADVFARFRLSQGAGVALSYTGLAKSGEVEDYKYHIEELDYGDAPESPVALGRYPTLFASNGARHILDGTLYMGTVPTDVDSDPDGQPVPAGLGDDNDGNDDEEGVVFTTPLLRGLPATVEVTASAPGRLDAWIDFNGDGDWTDPNEYLFTSSVALVAGVNPVNFSVPPTLVPGPTLSSFARFRISYTGGLTPVGLARGGEVEDHPVDIHSPSEIRGAKFWDVNRDGLRQLGEPGLGGWLIYADQNNSGSHDAGEPFDVTNASGQYSLSNLPPDTYKVVEQQQLPLWTQSAPAGGSHIVPLASGTGVSGKDFGNWMTADYDFDRDVIADDIDLLVAQVRNGLNDPDYDLNGDMTVDAKDLEYMVKHLVFVNGDINTRGSYPGDGNLTGYVDDDDLAVLLANWGSSPAGWALGNYTTDTIVNDDDLAVLLGNWTGPPPPLAASEALAGDLTVAGTKDVAVKPALAVAPAAIDETPTEPTADVLAEVAGSVAASIELPLPADLAGAKRALPTRRGLPSLASVGLPLAARGSAVRLGRPTPGVTSGRPVRHRARLIDALQPGRRAAGDPLDVDELVNLLDPLDGLGSAS